MSVLTIYDNGQKTEHFFSPGENILTLLRKSGYHIDAPCGGAGICGKCKVMADVGNGIETVLACKTVPNGYCTVYLGSDDLNISVNTTENYSAAENDFAAAVDLGTSTVEVSITELESGARIGKASCRNVQKSFGADVLRRIEFCKENADGLMILGDSIRAQIYGMINELSKRLGIKISRIKKAFLAGNTVMEHIFAGISPENIASAPFSPQSYFDDGKPVMLGEIPVYMSPCISGYVGGDVTVGLFDSGLYENGGTSLYLDIGTNGEMALGGMNGFTACAVACGPAFEGAEISCGMQASDGAVCGATLTDGGISYEVIGGGDVKGICGSGLLDLTACLLDLGMIDESGYLEENDDGESRFYITDNVYLDGCDIRNLQLAKAAVAAGIRILTESAGIGYGDIDAVYIAGAFGNHLSPESAARIGMLPRELLGKIVPCGNGSLSGAEKALIDINAGDILTEIRQKCRYIELSTYSKFTDCFLDEMEFPEVTI